MNTQPYASPLDALRSEPSFGKTLRARYRLDSLLGRGAMGSVYRAWDLERQTDCAVKLLQVEGSVREAALIRFRDEARMAAQIFHPHVVEILDHGVETDGSPFIVMELLQGQDLDARLRGDVRLSIEQTLQIVSQTGSALHAIHQVGIVHRDIKPRNIFLVQSPHGTDGFSVKVIDFGLAKHLFSPPGGRGSDGLLIGTPEYLPPESWRGVSADVDTRADQWALAVLTFRLLTGRLPFESQLNTMLLGREILSGVPRRIQSFAPEIPQHIASAIERGMAKDKQNRFASIHDFVRALSNLPLTTNTMNTAGTEFLPKVMAPHNAVCLSPDTLNIKREEPTKIVAAPDLTVVTTVPPSSAPSVPWMSQTCLLPSSSASTVNGAIHASIWQGASSLLSPIARFATAAVLGGLATIAIYSGTREVRRSSVGVIAAQAPPTQCSQSVERRSLSTSVAENSLLAPRPPEHSPAAQLPTGQLPALIIPLDRAHSGQKESTPSPDRRTPKSVSTAGTESRASRRSSAHSAKHRESASTSVASFGYPKAASDPTVSARSPALVR